MNELGNNLKKLRKAKKLSQPMLAERLNVTRSAVSAYENGSRYPSYDVLAKISQVFNVTLDVLFGISKDDTINVSGLSDKQREILQVITETFRSFNKIYEENYSGKREDQQKIDGELLNYLIDIGIIKAKQN